MENETKIPLFRRFIIQNFPYIEQDFDALTDYQLISKIVEYLNQVITSQNGLVDDMNQLETAFNTLKDYVDHYFDNLDVQEEINNKLDAMVEAGTLQEMIDEFLQANVTWTFDTVADMKLATNLIDGSYARTLGFHSINDGGGAIYKISNSGTANESDVIAIGSTLYATLIVPTVVCPEIYGAYHDGEHNDAPAMQMAINSGHKVVMNNIYYNTGAVYIGNQDPSITGGWKTNIDIDASKSTITYTGGNSGFVIAGVNGGNIRFGEVIASNGTCIEMWSTNGNVRVAYVNIYFNILRATEKAIFVHAQKTSSGNGFINEINYYGGTIYSGEYGFYIEDNHETEDILGMGSHTFNGIGFEGCDNCIYINSINTVIRGFIFNNIRYIENTEAPLFIINGKINEFRLTSWGKLFPSRIDNTNGTIQKFVIIAPISNNASTSVKADGIDIINNEFIYTGITYGGKNLTKETGVDGTIVFTRFENQTSLSFVGITTTTASATLVSASNNPYTPTRRVYAVLTDATGASTARVSIETDGAIKFNTPSDNIGTAMYGQLVFTTQQPKT